MDQASKTIIASVLSLPTMSFHETSVATFVRWYALGLGLAIKEDRAGNLLVQYPPLCKGRAGRGRSRGVTFAAHMDHPGFEVIAAKGKRATVALWGRVDPKTFSGSRVVVYTAAGASKGKIGKAIPRRKHLGRSCFTLEANAPVSRGDFGHYDITAVAFRGGKIVTRAADNLVSVAALLDLFTRLQKKRAKVNVSALFTRAEEAGFLGAFAAMESGLIPKLDPLVVLECSSASGGNCTIGAGPVIRAGDLQSTYDPAIDVWMSNVATKIMAQGVRHKAQGKPFRYQRALLQGGRCEACVYVAEGYRTGGIALPLGNYHNHGPRGYAAEFVSMSDYDNLLKLISALAHNPMSANALKTKVAPIWKHYRDLKRKFLASK